MKDRSLRSLLFICLLGCWFTILPAMETAEEKETRIIQLDIAILEVTKSETIEISRPKVKTLVNQTAEIVQGERIPRKGADGQMKYVDKVLRLFITPQIVEGEGIRLLIKIENRTGENDGSDTVVEKTFMAQNLGTATIDLLENKKKKSRIVAQITPLLLASEGSQEIAYDIEVKIIDDILVLDGEKVLSRGMNLDFVTRKANPTFIFLYLQGQGGVLLSFHPFDKAAPQGVCEGHSLRFTVAGQSLEWISMEPILPKGKWTLWTRHFPHFQLDRLPREVTTFIERKRNVFYTMLTQEQRQGILD